MDLACAAYLIPDATTQKPLFISPFVLDPNNSNRILAGGASLSRTDDCKTPNDDHAYRAEMGIDQGSHRRAECIGDSTG